MKQPSSVIKSIVAVLLFFGLSVGCAIAQTLTTLPNTYTKPAPYTNTGGDVFNQSVTTAFSPSCPAGSTSIQIEPYGGAINVRTDGTTATAAAPVIEYQALTAVTLSPTPLSNISIIAVSGTNTTIGAECLK
jgi:hypothetical protein